MMKSTPIIAIEAVSKVYRMYASRGDRVAEMLNPFGTPRHTSFAAIDNLSLTIMRGESLGIVGVNGSGKSTLLKLLCGVLTPTSGRITVNGEVSALLELGAGFNPDRSGLDNLYFQGAIQGYSVQQTRESIPGILEFADIGDFIYQPVKTYSSGMFIRLAFAAAIQNTPDVLIVDEALAVGDVRFQRRCFRKIEELKKQGVTFIFVSHSSEQIVTHCTRALLLSHGKLIMDSEPKAVVNRYLDILFGKDTIEDSKDTIASKALTYDEKKTSSEKIGLEAFFSRGITEDHFTQHMLYNKYEYRWGNMNALICDVHMVSDNDLQYIVLGDKITIYVKALFKVDVFRPIWGCTIKNTDGLTIYATNSEINARSMPQELVKSGSISCVCFSFQCNLAPGQYFISLGLACDAGHTPLDRRYDAILLNVNGSANFFGLSDLSMSIQNIEYRDE